MSYKMDLTGQKINGILVLKKIGVNKRHKSIFLCKCFCGNEFICIGSNLKNGNTGSCGCLAKKVSRNNGLKNRKHNLTNTRLFNIWHNMKQRCFDKNCKSYKYYGNRGIIMCKDWKDNFINFYNWSVNNGYDNNLSIDRIDNNRNYEPSNCRWVNNKVQANNRRSNHIIEYNNQKHTLKEWSEILNIDYDKLKSKIRYQDLDGIINNNYLYKNKKYITYKNITKTVKEWSKILNISYSCLSARIRRNWDLDKIFINYKI